MGTRPTGLRPTACASPSAPAGKTREYLCGHCEQPSTGIANLVNPSAGAVVWFCLGCGRPTYTDKTGANIPSAASGEPAPVHAPEGITNLYYQARGSLQVGAFNGAAMLCRRILLDVASNHGLKWDGRAPSFQACLKFLVKNEDITQRMLDKWLDKIRVIGNGANHELTLVSMEEAAVSLRFTGWLLRILYDAPAEAADG